MRRTIAVLVALGLMLALGPGFAAEMLAIVW